MTSKAARNPERDYAMSLARATAGATIFGLPLLMTMEMWFLGVAIQPIRLLSFLFVNFVILVGLSRFGGFERTETLAEDVLDAFAACAVGTLISALVLWLFGLVAAGMPIDEIAGKIAIQSVPCSFGAMIARKQLSGAGEEAEEKEDEEALRGAGYGAQLFLMAAGALFLSFNLSPTEEMALIGYMMTPERLLVLMALSIALLHALVYLLGLAGQEEHAEGAGFVRTFMTFTIPGYALALLLGLYVLWTFGRVDGTGLDQLAATMVVIAFPGALGAAIARLVV